jgi:hypothetical protein
MHTIFWSENMKGRDHPEDVDVDGKKGSWGNRAGMCGLGASGLC